MLYAEFAKAVLLLNLLLLFFLLLVYLRKIKKRKSKKQFLFGLLFMVIVFMIKTLLSLFSIKAFTFEYVLIMSLETIAFGGLLFAELSDLKKYSKG